MPAAKQVIVKPLRILAGSEAYRHVRTNGLSPEDISAVFGASGAAKWLAIVGLDQSIFSDWLPRSSQSIDLYGTSVGAFKLAAAAQQNAGAVLTQLADAYIAQDYVDKDIATQVVIETERVINSFLGDSAIDEILNNSRFNYHCGTTLCRGWLGSSNPTKQKLAMVNSLCRSLLGRGFHHSLFDRCVFHSGETTAAYSGNDGFRTHRIPLSRENIFFAVQASGSIPVLMPSVGDIPGAPPGTHCDGGVLDYHPVPSNLSQSDHQSGKGFVLYPHFYSYLKEGWFDKFWPWRKAVASQLSRTIILAPSDKFVASLPGGQIPNRQDFRRFEKNDQERIRRWKRAVERSIELGEAFLQLAESGEVAAHVELMD